MIHSHVIIARVACCAIAVCYVMPATYADTTDFETTAAGVTPVDNAMLSESYVTGPTSVRFGFDTTDDLAIDTNAHFESRETSGDTISAYKSGPTDSGPLDGDLTPAGSGGNWLLRAPGNFGNGIDIKGGDDFLVVYSGALPTSASGQIWDIDGVSASIFERWLVEALDESGNLIASQTSPQYSTKSNPPVDSRDGWPWTFSFDDLDNPIEIIRVSWTGEIGGFDAGFAFDNFNATVAASDQDRDGIDDADDNCVLIENPDQRDSNGDGFGNACDADLNDDCVVNVVDLGLLKSVFFTADPDADFNGDSIVNVVDLGIMKTGFFMAPGPSSWPNGCDT